MSCYMEDSMPADASFIVLYSNDAAAVNYTDGSTLQLSACGSSFFFTDAPQNEHLLHGNRSIQQRTQFATSLYKEKVRETLNFRNCYAQRPYLCSELLSAESVQRIAADIDSVTWPSSSIHAQTEAAEDGSVTVNSSDGWAKLTLAPCHQYFTVQYFSRLSDVSQRRAAPSLPQAPDTSYNNISSSSKKDPEKQRIEKLLQYCIKTDLSASSYQHAKTTRDGEHYSANQLADNIDDNTKSDLGLVPHWQYTWTAQQHSVFTCPKEWKHPLALAIQHSKKLQTVAHEMVEDEEIADSKELNSSVPESEDQAAAESETGIYEFMNNVPGHHGVVKCVYTPLPSVLPLKCTAPHLHKWDQQMLTAEGPAFPGVSYVNGRIKVVMANRVVYRLCWDEPKTLEIYPGDGSMLRTSDTSGNFFSHYINNGHKIEERMYATANPPPNGPSLHYSIAKILARASRLLSYLYDDHLSLQSNCCWCPPSPTSLSLPFSSPVLLEECSIPGVGQFSAYSTGRVRILFDDRTALDMWADFTKRMNQQGKIFEKIPGELPMGVCRLLLPNGHYQHVLISHPNDFQRYVKVAQEWVGWVNANTEERSKFYEDTIYDPVKNQQVQRELLKIKCFNYIVEQKYLREFQHQSDEFQNDSKYTASSYFPSLASTTSSQVGYCSDPEITFEVVNNALQRTSEAVADLEKLLHRPT